MKVGARAHTLVHPCGFGEGSDGAVVSADAQAAGAEPGREGAGHPSEAAAHPCPGVRALPARASPCPGFLSRRHRLG